jgi:hypothetical protein
MNFKLNLMLLMALADCTDPPSDYPYLVNTVELGTVVLIHLNKFFKR